MSGSVFLQTGLGTYCLHWLGLVRSSYGFCKLQNSIYIYCVKHSKQFVLLPVELHAQCTCNKMASTLQSRVLNLGTDPSCLATISQTLDTAASASWLLEDWQTVAVQYTVSCILHAGPEIMYTKAKQTCAFMNSQAAGKGVPFLTVHRQAYTL